MCFHNSMSRKTQDLASRYKKDISIVERWKDSIEEKYHVNALSFPEFPIITADSEIQVFNWGLIPYWTPDEDEANKLRNTTVNVPAETIFQEEATKEPIIRRRCLIPSTGYFEFHYNYNNTTTAYFIYENTQDIFSIAGIYDEWTCAETGETKQTFSVITTTSNYLTSFINNGGNYPYRMPVILKKDYEEGWLNAELSEKEINFFLQPIPDRLLDAYPVSSDFMVRAEKDQSIIEPILDYE